MSLLETLFWPADKWQIATMLAIIIYPILLGILYFVLWICGILKE